MEQYRMVIGAAALVIGIVAYIPYFRDIFRGTTNPHPFSWFVWGLVSGIAFFAQVASGGGIGAWTTGITAAACFAIAVLAVERGEHRISRLDVLCFVAALIGMVIWRVTHNPLNAVIIVLVVDFLGFIPTVTKAYRYPREETLSNYVLSLSKWGLGIAALSTVNLTTVLFPAGVFVMNSCFCVLLFMRRRQV